MKSKSLNKQMAELLMSKSDFGVKKSEAKNNGNYEGTIRSWETFHAYEQTSKEFTRWAKENYNAKTIDDLKSLANNYIEYRNQNYSAWTVKKDKAALNKIFGAGTVTVKTNSRSREKIFKGRDENTTNGRFDFNNAENQNLKSFCEATGLRRHELLKVAKNDIYGANGKIYVNVVGGKGGKNRVVECLNDFPLKYAQNFNENAKLFNHVPSAAPIHRWRANYAQNLYKKYENRSNLNDKNKNWKCRNDKKNLVLDRVAMAIASKNLGHTRLSVISSHYLYDLD